MNTMKIAVFCSANSNLDPDFFKMTEELGRWMAENGHTLVFGGCNLGLMECVAKAVHDAGGTTIGVVPMIIEKGGKVSDHVDVKMMCDNLSDRKDLMLAQCDVAVAATFLFGLNILSITSAMAPSPVTLHAVPKLSMAM